MVDSLNLISLDRFGISDANIRIQSATKESPSSTGFPTFPRSTYVNEKKVWPRVSAKTVLCYSR